MIQYRLSAPTFSKHVNNVLYMYNIHVHVHVFALSSSVFVCTCTCIGVAKIFEVCYSSRERELFHTVHVTGCEGERVYFTNIMFVLKS